MSLTIPDEVLTESGLDERSARIEIACRLFAAGKLSSPAAARWTELTRTEFESELLSRDLPLVVIDDDYLRDELHGMQKWENP